MNCECGSTWIIVCQKCHQYTQTFQWIAMQDKVPEEGGHYLTTDGEEIQTMHYFGTYKGEHEWSSAICCTLNVTHWMELPGLPGK